jgi:hypothetical protein
MSVIIRQLDYPWYKTQNHWRSIDAHCHNGVSSVSLSLMLIQAGYTSFMNDCIQLPLRLPKMQDQKSLSHRWLSFSGWGRERSSLNFDHNSGQYSRKEQWYTNVNVLRLAIGYLNATINRNTQNQEPEIVTDGSRQSRQHPRVSRFMAVFGPPRYCRSGFWKGLQPTRTSLLVWTRTGC